MAVVPLALEESPSLVDSATVEGLDLQQDPCVLLHDRRAERPLATDLGATRSLALVNACDPSYLERGRRAPIEAATLIAIDASRFIKAAGSWLWDFGVMCLFEDRGSHEIEAVIIGHKYVKGPTNPRAAA
jgi:hypothetical protein